MTTITSTPFPISDTKSAEFLSATIKNVFINDKECDPDIKNCFEGISNAYKINKKVGKKQLQEIGGIANNINDKFRAIIKNVDYYGMSLENPDIDRFIKRYRAMCGVLRTYAEKLKGCKNSSDLDRVFRTVRFEYDQFNKDYVSVKNILKERDEYEPRSKTGQFWSLVKWVWKYKYIIYISGLLFYNTSIYVFPEEVSLGIDLIVRIAGSVCYTFASDRVSMIKLIEVITSIVMLFGAIASQLLPDFIGKIVGKIPKFLKKLLSIGSSIIFYFFTYFQVDWISYLVKLICQGILVARAAVLGGSEMTQGIWLVFADAAAEIGGKVSIGVEFIKAAFTKGGDVIMITLSKLFVSILYEGVISPTKDFVTHLPGKVGSFIKDKISSLTTLWQTSETGMIVFDQPNYAKQEEFADRILKLIRDTGTQVTTASDIEIEEGVLALSLVDNANFQVALSDNAEVFVHQTAQIALQTFEGIKSSGEDILKKVNEKVQDTFSETIKKFGSERLWNDLNRLEFENSIVPYIMSVMLVLSILSIMLGI